MANHDFSAFDKSISTEKIAEIKKYCSHFLVRINPLCEKLLKTKFFLDKVSVVGRERFENSESIIMALENKIAFLLNKNLSSHMISCELGDSKKSTESFNQGVLGEKALLHFFNQFNLELNIKYYFAAKEYFLDQTSLSYIACTFSDKDEKKFMIIFDQIHEKDLVSYFKS